MDELTTTCYRCGAQGATKYLESLNAWVHHDTRICVSALRTRAETAERRIAELEAQLAAQAWRPVDDLDLDRGSDVDILARGHYDPEMGGVMLDSRDFLLSDGEDFIAWRPRTTSPIDPPAPA